MATLAQLVRGAEATLATAGVASPRSDAQVLAEHCCGVPALQTGFSDLVPSESQQQCFDAALRRRATREPLQHIVGSAPFGPLDLAVGPGVFVPRPETEVLADWAVRHLASNPSPRPAVVDLCSGSGALAAYIATQSDLQPTVYAVELSRDALEYTRKNTCDYGVEVVQSDVCAPIQQLEHLAGSVDLIVANPPYVPVGSEVDVETGWDPASAVFSGEDGMTVIRGMLPQVVRLLKPGGWVGIEHDDTTSELVCQACADAGLVDTAALEDFTGRRRFVVARKVA
jgi:methyltransferase, hemK family